MHLFKLLLCLLQDEGLRTARKRRVRDEGNDDSGGEWDDDDDNDAPKSDGDSVLDGDVLGGDDVMEVGGEEDSDGEELHVLRNMARGDGSDLDELDDGEDEWLTRGDEAARGTGATAGLDGTGAEGKPKVRGESIVGGC